MRPPLRAASLLAVIALVLAGCGGGGDSSGDAAPTPGEGDQAPALGQGGGDEQAATDLGFPAFATRNTTRVGGADPIADAAAVAQAVYPSRDEDTRPEAVALVDSSDWRVAVSTAQLMAPPLRAPMLFSDGGSLPPATEQALGRLIPTGAKQAGQRPDHPRRPGRRGRGLPRDVRRGRGLRRARAGDRPAADRGGREADRRRHRRLGGAAGLRDAGRRLGREVRPAGAVGHARRDPAVDARGDHRAQAAADLRARPGGGDLGAGREAARRARPGQARERRGPGRQRDRLRPRAGPLERRRPRPRPRLPQHPAAARRRRPPRRSRRPAPTARNCCSPRGTRCPRRSRTTCSTSSPATTRTRSAASTTTAG